MTDQPAVNLARRLFAKHCLQLPVDVERLVRMHAELTYAPLNAISIDGISINLKVPRKISRVVVNNLNPSTRQRFTLAHELGHLLIPWNTGTIVDELDPGPPSLNNRYFQMESEANMFAAELLMPWNWIATLIRAEPNVATIHVRICHDCDVSPIAAAITLARALVGDYIYAAERDGVVEFSGKTKSTAAPRPTTLAKLSENAYEYSEAHYATAFAGRLLHWWKLPAEIVLAADDNRSWRELLHLILVDIGTPQDKLVHAARSINGVIAAANGAAKLKGITSQAGIVAVCVQRMRDRNEFADFVSHPMFDTFISKRSSDFVSNNASLG